MNPKSATRFSIVLFVVLAAALLVMWSVLGFPLTHDETVGVVVGRVVEESDGGFTGKTYYSLIVAGILSWFAYHRMLGDEDPKPLDRRKKQRYWLFLVGFTIYELLHTLIRAKISSGSWIPFILECVVIVVTYVCLFSVYDRLLPKEPNPVATTNGPERP